MDRDSTENIGGFLYLFFIIAVLLFAVFIAPKQMCNHNIEKYPDQTIEWRGGDCMIQIPFGPWVPFSDETLTVILLSGR